MTSLYKVLQKAIPLCASHSDQAIFYNIDQHAFMCQQCIDPVQQTFQYDSINQNSHKIQDSVFSLEQIVSNPILLMLRQNSFLSKVSPETNKYHVDEFLKILGDMDNFVKAKKSSLECTKELMVFLKESITTKIDTIITRSEQNLSKISQIEDKAQYLKRINTEYYNQFLQTLEQTYVKGTSEELNELLKRYSIQNENPFRRIEQKVLQITKDIEELSEINLDGCLELQKKLMDPYIWSDEKLFLIPNHAKLLSKKQQSVILPDVFPHLLGFGKEKQPSYIEQSLNESIENGTKSQQNNIYVKCFGSTMQILLKNNQEDFNLVDTFECQDSSIDMLYELPQKMLMTVSYSSVKFYSYQFNKIRLVQSINSIKGCSQVLIFGGFCMILAENQLYKIRYSSLGKAQQVRLQIPDTEMVTQIQYLYENQRKRQDCLLAKTQSKSNGQSRNLKLHLS